MPYDVKAAVRPRHNTTGALLEMKGGKRPDGSAAADVQHQAEADTHGATVDADL